MHQRQLLLVPRAPRVGPRCWPTAAADRAIITVLAEVLASPMATWPQIGLWRVATAGAETVAVPGYGTDPRSVQPFSRAIPGGPRRRCGCRPATRSAQARPCRIPPGAAS